MSSTSSASKRARKMISSGGDEKRWSPPDSRRRFETRHNSGTRDASRNSHYNGDWGSGDGHRYGRWLRDDWSPSRRGRGGRPIGPSLPRRHFRQQKSVSSSTRGSLWHVSRSPPSPPTPWIRSQIPKLWRQEEEGLAWQLPERNPRVLRNVRRSKDAVVLQDPSNTTSASSPCPHLLPPPPLGTASPPSNCVTTMDTTTTWVWDGSPRNDDDDDDDDDLCDYSEVEDELEERTREWGAQPCAPLGEGAVVADDNNSGKCGGAIAWDDNSNGNSNDSGGSVVTQVGGANGGSGGGLSQGIIACATTSNESPTQLVPLCLGVGGWAKAQEGNTNEWIAHSSGAFVASAKVVQEDKRHAEWAIVQEGTTQLALHCPDVGLGLRGRFKKAKEGDDGRWGMHPFGSFVDSMEVMEVGTKHEESTIIQEGPTQSGPHCLDIGLGLGGQVKKASESKDEKWGVHSCGVFVVSKEVVQEGDIHAKRAIVQEGPTQSGPHFLDVGLGVGGHVTKAQDNKDGKCGAHPCGASVVDKEVMQEGTMHAKRAIEHEGSTQLLPHCIDIGLGGGDQARSQEGDASKCIVHPCGAFVGSEGVVQEGNIHAKRAIVEEGPSQSMPYCLDTSYSGGDQVNAQEDNACKWGSNPCGSFVVGKEVMLEGNIHEKWSTLNEGPTQSMPYCLGVDDQVKAQEGNDGEWGEHSHGIIVGGEQVVQEDNKIPNREITHEGLAHLVHHNIGVVGQVQTQQGNHGNWGAYPCSAFVASKEVVQEGKKRKKWETEMHNVIGGYEIPKEGNINQDGCDKGANDPRGNARDMVAQEGSQSINDDKYRKKCMLWTQACKLAWLYLNQASSY